MTSAKYTRNIQDYKKFLNRFKSKKIVQEVIELSDSEEEEKNENDDLVFETTDQLFKEMLKGSKNLLKKLSLIEPPLPFQIMFKNMNFSDFTGTKTFKPPKIVKFHSMSPGELIYKFICEVKEKYLKIYCCHLVKDNHIILFSYLCNHGEVRKRFLFIEKKKSRMVVRLMNDKKSILLTVDEEDRIKDVFGKVFLDVTKNGVKKDDISFD